MVGPASVAATPAGFAYGVAAAEITPSSAMLWTRAPAPGKLLLEVGGRRILVTVRAADDNTARVAVRRLKPDTAYTYRFRQGPKLSVVGHFRTAPKATSTRAILFAISGDADATRAKGASRPFFNNFQVYGAMARERDDFAINLGDTIYSDSGVPNAAPALTVAQKRVKYRTNLSLAPLRALRAARGVYNHWDDHEFINDFSRDENGDTLYNAGRKAFLEYMPATYSEKSGLYRKFRWGKNVELFFLDERSFRSAKASASGVCDNPPGTPDLAPTAPQPVRDAFAMLIPSLARAVPAACLGAISDTGRTMLGTSQLARFEKEVKASNATWKIVVNETPIHQFYALPYDRWEGYAAERRALLEYLRDNVKNVVFLATDTHANFYGEVKLQTLEAGGAVGTGIYELVTGPVATYTFAKEIDNVIGSPGNGSLITALFFKPQPPRGVGFQCAATDVYSFTQMRATSTTLTLTPRDSQGRPVREAGDQPCGPFTIAAR